MRAHSDAARVHALRDRLDVTAGEAIAAALDDWLGEHAAAFRRSEPFADPWFSSGDSSDESAVTIRQLLAAVGYVRAGLRPDPTVTGALNEALNEWSAAAAAEHHYSVPFQVPSSRR